MEPRASLWTVLTFQARSCFAVGDYFGHCSLPGLYLLDDSSTPQLCQSKIFPDNVESPQRAKSPRSSQILSKSKIPQ